MKSSALMEEGKMDEAAQAMAMLQQLLENLQMTEGGITGVRVGRNRRHGQLQDTLRDRQGLSDEAFRELQQGQGQQGETPQQPGEGEAKAKDRWPTRC